MDITSYILGKKAGGGSAPVLQDKEVEITENGETTITADSGYDGLSSVDLTTNIPQPSGKIEITQNGTDIDVSSYATADVNVAGQKYAPRWIRFSNYDGNNLDYEIESLDTKNINNMDFLFNECVYLTYIDISNWNTSNVMSMMSMFDYCDSTTLINMDNIDTSKVKDMTTMFRGCRKLTNLQCSNWNTSNVMSMMSMFASCASLTSLDIHDFTSTALQTCASMFAQCTRLTHIDMRSFNFTKSNLYTSDMFGASASNGVPNNCEIIVADATQKQWLNTNFSRLTNVKTVAELNE